RHRLGHIALRLMDLPKDRWAAGTAGLGTEVEAEIPASEAAVDFLGGFVVDRARPERRIPFADVVNEAYLNRVSLSEYAHYKFPHLTFNKLTGQGRAFLYYTQGAACSEVEIDSLTGETKVRRVDILMDLGRPINEALDRGQVAGAFVQGMGWVTTEKLHYSRDGLLLSHAPSTYKIPSIQDTPREFRIDLLENAANTVNVRGSKAVGEPPLLLAISVWTAIHDALRARPSWESKLPALELPATQEEVFRALHPGRKWE
ncbi:MAG: molybdopterin-dependent oxidoreductase, partial [Bdellovibrionales bacterium]|nr:molybdopterin-dependent oxidoreductase [Bdellovibrionales bacterium]